MRRSLLSALITVALAAVVAVPAAAAPTPPSSRAAAPGSSPPGWCHAAGTSCRVAVSAFSAVLTRRFGSGWSEAALRLEDCPTMGNQPIITCIAYFRSGTVYRLAEGDLDARQAAEQSASFYPGSISSWQRTWRNCSLRESDGTTLPGTLMSNQPCGSLPMSPAYDVEVELSNGRSVSFDREVGWQFTESAAFLPQLRAIALARCTKARAAITCTDGEGDSFRYTA